MLKKVFQNLMIKHELLEFLHELQAITRRDLIADTVCYKIDFDQLMTCVMQNMAVDKQYVKRNIKAFFEASDVDGDKTIDLEEFKNFVRPIDYKKYSDPFLERSFKSG